ncbi:two-component system CheB/CheR fusion protein [Humitalea rosea]|uniref:histidine kinase n=1 Tax=Humitalea rosea TaxID=990373 RepID=A0A2W7IN63_9PROT|nr:chemotaxis protein CheB [Humitalea rosea]PZW40807.1 two-component system CheB/CheR fusion protein [Humitalea rosea]
MPPICSPKSSAARKRSPSHGPSHGPSDLQIVGIGASAGGLDACRKLLDALPAETGMAYILVQHLDPTHESMMVDLLAGHTSMAVRQATDGARIEPDHIYVIPPGTYLSVGDGMLHLSQPEARHGARMPFDFLLHSLAKECGDRAICVILSGTGADGSLGLKAVKEKRGLVIVQHPDEAGYDGMPRSAIMTGAVDLVLYVAEIPAAIASYDRHMAVAPPPAGLLPQEGASDGVPGIIELLRARTSHDFRLYKQGTLERRIERRMAMAGIETDRMDQYLAKLRDDANELELLAKDLLINITSFFRDPKVFDYLAEQIIPDLVRKQATDHPLRIWITGCSTGEEAYSLAMLFKEEITAARRNVKLQVFASDVDADAVTSARDGLYPDTIEADVSTARLAHFFTKDEHGYRVSADLRAMVVFTVQDVLSDPPFSRIDLISCRNLLIYLQPEAQAKVISLFHFALREGGVLLLGSSETIGNADGRFEVISKVERLYRHVARSRPGDLTFLRASPGDGPRPPMRRDAGPAPSRQTALADLCRRLVMESYAPAAVLINRKHECLFHLGATDRFLSVAPGHPSHDLLAMARGGLRTKLRSAIQRASQGNERIAAAGGQTKRDGRTLPFSISVQPVRSDGEDLLLVCFVDEPKLAPELGRAAVPADGARLAGLEQELEATRTELQGAISDLETSSEEQKAINEEALSINEEYQSTNEELLTSKEELQSLNEELTALNSQLQETLERQRTTSNDLQNVLNSTDVATLFLDTDLNIRLFTPATRSLFNIIPGDIGRPLADLHPLAEDSSLLTDARIVLTSHTPLEREIETEGGAWYVRRILPYRTHDNGIEGVVITFADITERRNTADALDSAKRQAEQATAAKSRFLSAASHDLRQPLQALSLMGGILARKIAAKKTDEALELVSRLEQTSATMAGMLNALLDINQIDAGTVHADIINFPVNEMFERLRQEFAYQAQARGLVLRVVPCSLSIDSDPRLLEQMIRNILSNALKYTKRGKVLLGCRRRSEMLSIEIWDTGIGIPKGQLNAIFEEYHQLNNAARERSRGFGLGLAIVKRLGDLMGYRIAVRSRPGIGSLFAIEVGRSRQVTAPLLEQQRPGHGDYPHRAGSILVVEDDPDVRDLLERLLEDEGHVVGTAPDGTAALELIAQGTISPDLILADYNLPNGPNGIRLATRLREKLREQIPVIILTGDISTMTLREIAHYDCVQLNKPVKPIELAQVVQRLLAVPHDIAANGQPATSAASIGLATPVIFVVDGELEIRKGLRGLLEGNGWHVEDFATCEAFLEAYHPDREGCILIDAHLPGGMSGLELLKSLNTAGHPLPAIMITGRCDLPTAVQAMKAGAMDFIEKPVDRRDLISSVERALERARDSSKLVAWQEAAASHVTSLTPRQRQIMAMILAGHPSKTIAADLGIGQRMVENHRAAIMKKTGSSSLAALARLAFAAAPAGDDEPPH